MTDLLSSLLGPLWGYIAGAAAVAGAALFAWWRGWRAANARRAAQDAKAYKETMERAHDADVSSGDSNADAEWMRKRAKKR